MAASLAPGDLVLGKYRVERVIGQGGMGMVLAVRHTTLNELFAMKIMLNIEGVTGKQAFDRFIREARICASLKGEHVVKVQDVGELADGRPYIVMEYLEGQDLSSILEKKGPLSVPNAAAVILQACDALSEAHRLGIIHRDIKPPNMFLIRSPNGKIRLKLLDFGISKRVGAETKALTNTGAMMGSPLYMSPEQLTDARAVGPRTDIWAMGVVLYELLTGKVPFDGEMIFQVIQEILNKTPALPTEHRPSLPWEVDKIIERALRKDPAQRYETIEEFARDVRQMLNANSVISSSVNLLNPSEPEVNLEIEPTPFDPASLGPTLEASSEDLVGKSIEVRVSEPTPEAQAAVTAERTKTTAPGNRAALTHSDLTKTLATSGPAKTLSPMTLAIGAVLLLALGGVSVYLIQNGLRSTNADSPTESRASNPISAASNAAPALPATTAPAPVITAAPEPTNAPAAASATAPTIEPTAAKNKTKTLPGQTLKTGASAAPTATTSTRKHEGLL
ncbi:MAG TPA: serine/threonine-protein kinase [Polyangium sp.]|nr:serine/threonine-protein kinase [Polyangium sp.]